MTTPTARRRPPPTFHQVTVSTVARLTPRTRRITFTGEALADYPNDGPASHCKLLLPGPGTTEVTIPTLMAEGQQAPTATQPVRRTYTPHSVDTARCTLTIDFALHEQGGPASTWAAAAGPGDDVVVTGGRGAYRIDPAADWTLLVADDSALPAIATILDEAPAGARVLLVAEVADPAEHRSFSTRADLSTTWRHSAAQVAGPRRLFTARSTLTTRWSHLKVVKQAAGMAAADEVERLTLPPGEGRGWVGLEATAMRRVRRHLLTDCGLDRAALHTRAYWKYGASNHPDHDSGEDDGPSPRR